MKLATYKNKNDRDFRLYANEDRPSLDFNKIKVGKSTISGDIASIINDFDKKKNRSIKIDRDKIEKAISDNNVKVLRQVSDYFFRTSGIYSRLCRYMAYLYKYDWFIVPRRLSDNIKDDKVIEGWVKASVFLERCNLKRTFGEIALKVIKNGSYYGYLMKEPNGCYLQELPANYCRSRYRMNGQYLVEFNIKYFDEAFSDMQYRLRVLKMFPKEFQKAYIAYKNGSLEKDYSGDETGWFLLDSSLAVRFCLCDSDAPLFISVIPALLDLEDAKKLDKDKMAQQLLKIVIQKLPIDKNGDLIFDVDEGQMLHNNAVAMLSEAIGVDVLTTFADVDVADLSDRSNVSSVDWIEKAEHSVYTEGGVSQNQFNTSGNLALEKSIANDEATLSDLIYQFEEFAERLLAPFNKNSKKLFYSFHILPTTIYNYKDLAKMYKDQTNIGFSKLLPQVAMGHSQADIISTAIFENGMMKLNDLFTPPQMSSTTSGTKAPSSSKGSSSINKDSDNTGGRPELPDSEKSEKTIQNLESQS